MVRVIIGLFSLKIILVMGLWGGYGLETVLIRTVIEE